MKDYDAKTVGKNIKEYRKAKGLSQKELGGRCGLSASYIGSLENGYLSKNGSGSVETIIKIANALNVTLDDLAGTNLEYRQYGLTNTNPTINKIMMEMETIPHSRILLFRNIINALIT